MLIRPLPVSCRCRIFSGFIADNMTYGRGCEPFLKGEASSLEQRVGMIHNEGFSTPITWPIL